MKLIIAAPIAEHIQEIISLLNNNKNLPQGKIEGLVERLHTIIPNEINSGHRDSFFQAIEKLATKEFTINSIDEKTRDEILTILLPIRNGIEYSIDSNTKEEKLYNLKKEINHLYGYYQNNDSRTANFKDKLRLYVKTWLGDNGEFLLASINEIDSSIFVGVGERDIYYDYTGRVVTRLLGIIESIEIALSEFQSHATSKKLNIHDTKKIFIVHGHDDAMKQEVARVIERLGMEPIILHEQADKGKHILGKLQDNANVGFAIVLFSPDDKGYSVNDGEGKIKSRARQNVVFELGMFIEKINTDRVVVLLKGDVEVLSDYEGILYKLFDEHGGWKNELVKELKAAGYKVDANNLT